MGNKIGVPIAQGLDVSNFFKDVPNFVNDVPNFVNDVPNIINDVPNFVNDVPNFVKTVPRLPKFVLSWEEFPNEEMDHGKRDKCLISSRIGCIKISQ